MTSIAPTTRTERIQIIDVLRGLAIFGILMVNIHYFAKPWAAPPPAADAPLIDRAADLIVQMFFTTKFFNLFSFLFGLGMALQMQRAEAKGVRFVPLYLRRLGILALFGLAHGVLIWIGDILLIYAILGLLLLLLWRRAKPRTLLIWAGSITGVLVLLFALSGVMLLIGRSTPEGAAQVDAVAAEQEAAQEADYAEDLVVYGMGSYGEVTAERAGDFLEVALTGNIWIAPTILSMFLLGLYAGKRKIFHDVEAHLPLFRRVLLIALPIGLLTNLYWAFSGFNMASGAATTEPGFMLGMLGLAIGGPALCLCYISAVVLLTRSARWSALTTPFAAVGRLALTNYLLHSIIFTTLFYGYGFGLMNAGIGYAAQLLMGTVVYILQIPFSTWWMRNFRFGPFEWLWRSLTYMRLQPMRRALPPAVEQVPG